MDIHALRRQTPACEKQIHFNNAGASLMPDVVSKAVIQHIELERDIGGYEAQARAQPQLDAMYENLATLLGADASEIAFVENATRAWDMAFYSLPLKAGDRVLTHGAEYASNYLAFLHQAKRRGIEIDLIPSDSKGQLDIAALPKLLKPSTKLIAITHVPTQSGLINPAADVGRFAKEHGLLYLLDACQSVGQLNVNVKEIGCHFLSGTGRKFLRGPRGTGFLYVDRSVVQSIDPVFIDLHAATWVSPNEYTLAPDAKRFENWESYVAGRVGLNAAAAYTNAVGIASIENRVLGLGRQLLEELSRTSGVQLRDVAAKLCGIVTFTKQGISPAQIAEQLKQKNINVSVSVDVYSQLDLGARNIPAVVRASVHYYNTESEIEQFCRALHAL